MPTASRSRCGIVTRPCPSSFASSDEPKNRREYARPSASERGEDATSSERRSHSTLGKQNRQPSWPIVSQHAVRERLAEPRRQRHPALRVELIAVRAEQFGHALLPFPPLWSTFMPLALHRVNSGATERCVRVAEDRVDRTAGGSRRNGRERATDQVGLPAGLEPAEREAEAVASGANGRRARWKPASCGVRFSFLALQRRHAATTFSQVWRPPRERGIT